MKFQNTDVWGFKHAIRGMRNPKQSWNRSDSVFEDKTIIGQNDLKLMQTLIKAGPQHRKFMRQIFVSVDITAPLYWWKQFDTYKIGTVSNSTSTMHKLASTPITVQCFQTDDFLSNYKTTDLTDTVFRNRILDYWDYYIWFLQSLRQRYNQTKDKQIWKELIRILPESWLQTRTVTMNYQNLLAMCSKNQRRNHKLNEWSGIDNPQLNNFIKWARELPYAQQLIFIDEINE